MAEQGSQGLLSRFLREKRSLAAVPYLRGNVLDVGCGGGFLAQFVSPERYVGFDVSGDALEAARRAWPSHVFTDQMPSHRQFDTVVALAVIEHVKNPEEFLFTVSAGLTPEGRIVLTTPHPHFRKVHDIGAMLGLFSRDAAEEHESFLDDREIRRRSRAPGLEVAVSRRFLLGANQLFVLAKQGTCLGHANSAAS
jgi:2-polyprenyl-3-methyl-5-hydroxy-6-metoxy-1,4-benzoquinol methylase